MIPFNPANPLVTVEVDCGLPANVGIHPVELPYYRPVENLMPLWRTARIVLAGLIPKQLEFKENSDNRGVVGPDLDWLNRMYWMAPVEDSNTMMDLIASVVQLFCDAEDASSYEHMLGEAITPLSLGHMGHLLASHDQQRQARGWPTLLEIAKHVLGLEPAPGTVCRHIKIELTIQP